MSREFKFRVWDNTAKRWLSEGESVEMAMLTRFVPELKLQGEMRGVIEQYTGLKDENGKEIYEGDIVSLTGEWEELEKDDCKVITFRNGCFRVGNDYEDEAGTYLEDWRVVGNIHENPELVGGKE